MKGADGTRREITDFESSDFGGIIAPGESWSLVINDVANLPKEIPVEFEGEGRPTLGQVFIDRDKLMALDEKYKAWKAAQVKK